MNDRYTRYYIIVGHGLILLWIIWWLFPFSPETDPYGGIKFVGFLLIEVLFLILGLFGYFFWLRGQLNYEMPTCILSVPVVHLIGLLSEDPGTLLVSVVYALGLMSLPLTTIIYWLRGRR